MVKCLPGSPRCVSLARWDCSTSQVTSSNLCLQSIPHPDMKHYMPSLCQLLLMPQIAPPANYRMSALGYNNPLWPHFLQVIQHIVSYNASVWVTLFPLTLLGVYVQAKKTSSYLWCNLNRHWESMIGLSDTVVELSSENPGNGNPNLLVGLSSTESHIKCQPFCNMQITNKWPHRNELGEWSLLREKIYRGNTAGHKIW